MVMDEAFFQLTEVYPWQQSTWQTLTSRFPEIGHGILFYGKSGCGKSEFTSHFVAWVLCLNKMPTAACGHCSSCQWLKSKTHPNYVHISNDQDSKRQHSAIKIDKIRELQPFIQQTVDGWRVVVIEPADALNIASANALLKTLEEPGERVLIILVTTHFLKLPATIRSRLQRYALDRVSNPAAKQHIAQVYPELDERRYDLLLNLANHMPLQAVALQQQPWLAKRTAFMQDWQALVVNKTELMVYATKWSKELGFLELLHMIEYLLADLICFKLNQSMKNIDLDFTEISNYYQLSDLFAISEKIQPAKGYIQQNVQTNLIIDDLFVTLLNLKP